MSKKDWLLAFSVILVGLVTLSPAFAAGSPEAAGTSTPVTIEYWLWNANQLPAYQAAADEFMRQNPDVIVELTQLGWNDYWNSIQTGMVAGTAPDVFVNHLARYPEFASRGQLVDLGPLMQRDGVGTDHFLDGLADLWIKDGERYGMPKDWDTVAVVYNKAALSDAGVTDEMIANWTWDPETGGTFQEIMERLTVDSSGRRADEAGFDPQNVTQYGMTFDFPGMGAYGQTSWSAFAASTGWRFNDGIFGSEYYYDDPRFVATIAWWERMANEEGLVTPFTAVSALGTATLFSSQQAAMMVNGSWRIGSIDESTDFEFGFARLPIGPVGRRSMFNGVADSIWSGTEHPEESWRWVKFLGSQEAQDIVGRFGVVFPAVESSVELALSAYETRGLDVSAFTEQATEPNGTFLFPITDNASEITQIMQETFDSIFLGRENAESALVRANRRINALFE